MKLHSESLGQWISWYHIWFIAWSIDRLICRGWSEICVNKDYELALGRIYFQDSAGESAMNVDLNVMAIWCRMHTRANPSVGKAVWSHWRFQ